jgi:hypothetical protein
MTQDQLLVAFSIRISARRGWRRVDEAGSVKCIAIRVATYLHMHLGVAAWATTGDELMLASASTLVGRNLINSDNPIPM